MNIFQLLLIMLIIFQNSKNRYCTRNDWKINNNFYQFFCAFNWDLTLQIHEDVNFFCLFTVACALANLTKSKKRIFVCWPKVALIYEIIRGNNEYPQAVCNRKWIDLFIWNKGSKICIVVHTFCPQLKKSLRFQLLAEIF